MSLLLAPAAFFGSIRQTSAVSEVTGIQAVSKGIGTMVTWRVENAESVIGYSVFRLQGKSFVRVNGAMVPGGYVLPAVRELKDFTYFDPEGMLGDTYRIEVTELEGGAYFSSSTQSVFSSEFEQPAGRDGLTERSDPILIKNYPAGYDFATSLTDLENQRWVASQPGVKIMVKSTGLTRVSRAELANAGFDVNAPESNWQLYLNGIQQAIKIGPAGSYIEFLGEGVDLLETDKNVYFLVVGPGSGKRISPLHIRRISADVGTAHFTSTFQRKRKFLYLSTLRNGEEDNFFGELIGSNPVVIPFDLKGIDLATGKTDFALDFQGFTQVPHRIKVVVNGLEFPNALGNGRERSVTSFGVPASILQETGNTIELQSLNTSDLSLLASLSVTYKRKFEMDGGNLVFPTSNYRQTKITGVTDNQVRVFDISDPLVPAEVSNAVITPEQSGGFSITLPSARGREMIAVEPSAIRAADSVVANTPSTLSESSNAANFVIITNPAWKAEADLWAAYRASQGLLTKVVDVNDVFDEFSFGRLSSESIKSFLQHAAAQWTTGPSYVLLLGDSTYDPRNFEGQGNFNFVPVMLIDTQYEETGSDDALTDFDDDGLAEIPIGRIPVRAPVDVSNALQKVMTFESSVAGAPARGALCASDVPAGFDFQGLCGRLHDELPPSIPKTQVNRSDPDAKNVLIGHINAGKYIVNYSGHGTTGVWAHTSFFGIADVPLLTNQNNLTLFTMLTCLNGYFIRPVPDSLSEALLRSTAGGAVAVWSSTGSTTPDVQEVMATRFYNQLGSGSITRLGNLINDAKTSISAGRDVRLSWVLLGDPATIMKQTAPVRESKAGS